MSLGNLTLAQLRTLVRQEGDFVNSQFVTDQELNSYINQSYYELYDLMVQKYGDDYFVNPPYSFSTDGTTYLFPLPSDFYKLVGVDLALANSTDSYVTLHRFNFSDRNRYAVPNFQSFYGVTNLRYRLNADNIWLTPTPSQGQTIRLWYVPRLTELVADGDVADGVSGWLEYVVIDAAIKAKDKEESDTSVLMARKQAMIQRIEAAAENRDAANPMTVADNQYNDLWWPSGSGNGNGSGSF
jgi:cytochrome c-type biogenesis protein CcmH/NrfF